MSMSSSTSNRVNSLNQNVCPNLKSNELEGCTAWELVERLQVILENSRLRQEIINSKGDDAQRWLGFLQQLVDSALISTPFRSAVLKTITRLSKNSGLCPQSLVIQNVNMNGKYPVGGGGFADVWLGTIGQSDAAQNVCIKVMRRYLYSDVQELLSECLREAIVWKQLRHPNVLPFIGVYYLDDSMQQTCLVSPWMDHGNLVQYLQKTPRDSVDHLSLVHDIASGLSYLHSKDIVHADLKGFNILMTPSLTACICDFGLSRILDSQAIKMYSSPARAVGTTRWMAPELFHEPATPTTESDIYAFGCVCYEIITGRMPFHEFRRDGGVVAEKIAGRHPSRPADLPESSVTSTLWALMSQCWDTDPSARPPASTVVQRVKKPPLIDPPRHTMGRKLFIFLEGGSIVAAYTVTTSV